MGLKASFKQQKKKKLLANKANSNIEIAKMIAALKDSGITPVEGNYNRSNNQKNRQRYKIKYFKSPVFTREQKEILYYFNETGKQHEISPTEKIICKSLNKIQVHFFREVSFVGCGCTGETAYRFDFYIPDMRMVIEYDGVTHQSNEVKQRDQIKDSYCRKKKIKMVRFSGQHYNELERHVLDLFANSYLGV